MPVYTYSCEPCQFIFDRYVPLTTSEAPTCEKCSGVVERTWQITPRSGYVQYPYTTIHLTGSPIEVRDAAHERQLFAEHKVRRRDDAAWVTKEYKGYDPFTGKQVYTESSGVGIKGCWI